MQAGRRLYFCGQYAACKQGEDLPSPFPSCHICAVREVFAKLPYFAKSFAKLLEECFKRFCQKSRMPTPFAKLLEML